MKKLKPKKSRKRDARPGGSKPLRAGGGHPYPKRIAGMKDKYSDLLVVECAVRSPGGK